jgi:hypothetical protein
MMKQIQTAGLVQRGADALTRNASAPWSLFAARPLAVWTAIVHCLASAQAAEVVTSRQHDRQASPVQEAPCPPRGRQMERYKAFARQTELPPITVTSNTLIEVGVAVKLDISRLGRLTAKEQDALAGQFGVPVGVIEKLVQQVAIGSTPDADRLIQELRRAVIDYRFLRGEWERYNPPAEGQKTKRDATAALQAGDINKTWELYDGLRKPQPPAIGAPAPPSNLRVVAGP